MMIIKMVFKMRVKVGSGVKVTLIQELKLLQMVMVSMSSVLLMNW